MRDPLDIGVGPELRAASTAHDGSQVRMSRYHPLASASVQRPPSAMACSASPEQVTRDRPPHAHSRQVIESRGAVS